MNILLLGLVLYSYFFSTAPKVLKENKQIVLGMFIGVTIYQMNLVEGFGLLDRCFSDSACGGNENCDIFTWKCKQNNHFACCPQSTDEDDCNYGPHHGGKNFCTEEQATDRNADCILLNCNSYTCKQKYGNEFSYKVNNVNSGKCEK